MAARSIGTQVQLECVGPQDRWLTLRPEGTFWKSSWKRYGDFAVRHAESLAPQAFAFGRTSVFAVPADGDLLGEAFVELVVPRAQDPLGPDLPPWPPLPLDQAVVGASFGLASVGGVTASLDRLEAQPVEGVTVFTPAGQGFVFQWPDGLRWDVLFAPGGRVESTLTATQTSPRLMQPCRVRVQSGAASGAWEQRVGRGAAAQVTAGGEVRLANDSWRAPALTAMRRARLVVGDLVVQDHERLWYHVLDKFRARSGAAAGLGAMLGAGPAYPDVVAGVSKGRAHVLYLPLKFVGSTASTRVPLSLVGQPARVELQVESAATVGWEPGDGRWTARLVTTHFTLCAADRAAVRQSPLMLFETAQDMDAETFVVGETGQASFRQHVSVDLQELNLPVAWLACLAYRPGSGSGSGSGPGALYEYEVDWAERVSLCLDGGERQAGPGELFRWTQPWRHAGRVHPAGDAYLYSFALDQSGQPNGALTSLGSSTYPTLKVQLKAAAQNRPLLVKVFACVYNWLEFDRGSIRRAFAM